MVNALQALLTKVGVNKDDIRAEEFAGFTMDHSKEISNSRGRSYVLTAAIVLIAMVVIILHVRGVSHTDLSKRSFKNPITYLLITMPLFIAAFKVFALLKLKHAHG